MLERIQGAARILAGVAHRTPVQPSATLGRLCGAEVRLKCENLQRVGAFKFRGAYHALARLSDAQRRAGVIGFSSGNHAQALALAGRLLRVPVTVVMPDNAPAVKRAATLEYGARIVDYDPATQDREAVARGLPDSDRRTLIPPFDHLDVIAGQGTAALEFLEQEPELDVLLVPCGGGGLLSGSAVAAKALRPGIRVIGVEPTVVDDARRSFESGRLQSLTPGAAAATLADGLRTPRLGELSFPLIREHVDAFVTVSEGAIRRAVVLLATRARLVVEPSGAVAVAALLEHGDQLGGRVGVLLSGGNIDPSLLADLLRENPV